MDKYHIVAENPESTVVAEFQSVPRREMSFQSEAELEKEFIGILVSQAYEYLIITSELDLIKNLRAKLEKLNGFSFSDNEWKLFFNNKISICLIRKTFTITRFRL